MVFLRRNLQDSSQYSGRSVQYCSLDGLHSSSYFQVLQSRYQSFETVPFALITNGITVTFMFHIFFSSLANSKNLSLSASFQFYPVVSRNSKNHNSTSSQSFFFFLLLLLLFTITWSGRPAEIRWSVCNWKFQRILCVSFSWMDSGSCIYHLFISSNLNFFHNSQLITFSAHFLHFLNKKRKTLIPQISPLMKSYF